jgi:hypothetical protein
VSLHKSNSGLLQVISLFYGHFFVVNNGGLLNCDEMQQLKCNICFSYVILELIKKKTKEKRVIAYKKLFGIRFMT